MSEKTRSRTREAEPIKSEPYEQAMRWRQEFVQRQMNGVVHVKEGDRDWELCRQGYVKFMLHPIAHPETVLHDWYLFCFDVRKQSGMHRHQGGLIIFALKGEGATEVDGELVEWKAGDMILLPIKPNGVAHRHFQRSKEPAKWLAILYSPMWDHCGSDMTQLELSPEFKQAFGS